MCIRDSHYATLDNFDLTALNTLFSDMICDAEEVVRAGAPDGVLKRRRRAFMRYQGQGHEIEILLPDRPLEQGDVAELRRLFEIEYSRQFSRTVPGMTIEILDWAVEIASEADALDAYSARGPGQAVQTDQHRRILCDVTGRWRDAAVYDRSSLKRGDRFDGPALIIEPQTTTFVSADFRAELDAGGNIWLTRVSEGSE